MRRSGFESEPGLGPHDTWSASAGAHSGETAGSASVASCWLRDITGSGLGVGGLAVASTWLVPLSPSYLSKSQTDETNAGASRCRWGAACVHSYHTQGPRFKPAPHLQGK